MAAMSDIHHPNRNRARGFTIVELIVVVVIIGVLVTIMVPVLSTRSSEARITAAKQDLQHIADALERSHINTNYMFRLDALNDGIQGDAIANSASNNVHQGVRDIAVTVNNIYGSTFPYHVFISLETQSFPTNQLELYNRLVRNETAFGWQGPYMNWHRDANSNDWPDDPWGNDYLFFTRNGVIYPPVETSLTEQLNGWKFQLYGPATMVSDSTSGAVSRSFEAANLFDRPTVLSLGPNGLPGNGTNDINDGYGKGDDLFYQFGGN